MFYCLMCVVRLTSLTLTSYFILQILVTLEMNISLLPSANLPIILVSVNFSFILVMAIPSISYPFLEKLSQIFYSDLMKCLHSSNLEYTWILYMYLFIFNLLSSNLSLSLQ